MLVARHFVGRQFDLGTATGRAGIIGIAGTDDEPAVGDLPPATTDVITGIRPIDIEDHGADREKGCVILFADSE